VALIPLRSGKEPLGLLQLNDHRKGMFSARAIATWERLSGYLAAALAKSLSSEALVRSNEQLRSLAERLHRVREEEQKRISREIHDNLGQMLTSLKMDLRWIEKQLEARPGHGAVLDRSVVASTLIDELIAVVQRLSSELRPSALDQLGLGPALVHAAREFEQRAGIRCRAIIPQPCVHLRPEISTALYRIAQEALTNIARHAGARGAEVELRSEGNLVVLEVRDDGKGIAKVDLFDLRSLGLLGMRERAAQLGGDVTIDGGPGRGTVVAARIPLEGAPLPRSQG
jgi:signal transduction histidine kinase